MIRLLLADDHQMFREGVAAMLARESDLTIVAQTSNGAETVEAVRRQAPDIVLLDIEMPGLDGFDTMRQLRDRPELGILVLTMHKSSEFIRNILMAGASGYLHKDADRATLLEAIHSIYTTGSYHSAETARLLRQVGKKDPLESKISPRELEIIRLIADEHTTPEIAEALFISVHTVETHRQNILSKLGLKNTAGLVKYAIRRGLL